MSACPTLSPDGAFVSDLLGYVDCQAQTLGASGYQALASAGGIGGLAMTGFLTVFVALFGYRLLFGQAPGARDAVLAVTKIGIVLALATNWPAYRAVVYDVTLRAPAELVATIGEASALPGAGGGLEGHLQAVDNGLAELVRIGTGKPANADAIVGSTAAPQSAEQQAQQNQHFQQLAQRPRWDPQRDQELLGTARTVYLTGAIGSLAAVRLVAAVLLALGPLFVLFLLFDATRGIFEGWVRALLGAMLGGVSSAILLGLELAVLEPWLAAILAERQSDVPTPNVPIELLALSLVFALTLLAGVIASARVAYGLHVPPALREVPSRWIETLRSGAVAGTQALRADEIPAAAPERTRALAISDAVAATQRRDLQAMVVPISAASGASERGSNPQTPTRNPDMVAITPIGQSARRRTARRVSAGANRREGL